MRRQRPCLDCKRLTRNPSRCDTCQAAHQRLVDHARGSAHERGYTAAWQRVARAAIVRHRERHGDWCPGFKVPAHYATDLTGDHIIPKDRGGADHPSNVQVLCRACNARKHNR